MRVQMAQSRLKNLGSPVANQEGFALIAALAIVAILAVASVPLLDIVAVNQKSVIKQRLTLILKNEAREHLEIGVHLIKLADGVPAYFDASFDADEASFASDCSRRLNAADKSLLGNGSYSLTGDGVHSTRPANGPRRSMLFIVNKGSSVDSRYDQLLLVSCAQSDIGGLGLAAAELGKLNGSYLPLRVNEY